MDTALDWELMDELLGQESIVENVNSKEFKEFTFNVSLLGEIISPEVYLEAQVKRANSFYDKVSQAARNTRDTTKDTMKAYSQVTDGGGSLLKGTFDLVMSTSDLVIRLVTFILTQLAKIPSWLAKVVRGINNLPRDIKNRIKGNISLFITDKDVPFFYQHIFPAIDLFLKAGTLMSQGEMWSTMFTRDHSRETDKPILSGANDMKHFDDMKKAYKQVHGKAKFVKSVIQMDKPEVVNTYFGDEKAVVFYDLDRKKHETTYWNALDILTKDISSYKEGLESVQKLVLAKYDRTKLNDSYNHLSIGHQKVVRDTMAMASSIVKIIAEVIGCITKDLAMFNKTRDKLVSKGKVSVQSTKPDNEN